MKKSLLAFSLMAFGSLQLSAAPCVSGGTLASLAALGADIRIEHGFVVAKAKRLQGAVIRTDMVTVTGTENLMMAAVLAQGQTVLENAAREPEVVDLAELLIKMGARIKGHGTDRIVIDGVDALHGATHTVIADRIEAGSFLCAVGAAGGEVVHKWWGKAPRLAARPLGRVA